MISFDIGVIGLGAMGSAATCALAQRGARVLGLDRDHPPHSLGSSHGHSRIIREAYYEHPLYVPLVQRAYELWNELAERSRKKLLLQTGGLMAGPENGPLFSGAFESARTHSIAHDLLDADAVAKRFPAYRLPPGFACLHEQRAGMLFPEKCIAASLAVARASGAEIRLGETARSWRRDGDAILLETTKETIRVDRIVVAAGPWLPELAASLGVDVPVEIERQLSHWFEPMANASRYSARNTPVALWETPDREVFATLPDEGHGVKCGMHHAGQPTDPASVDRIVSDAENDAARELLEQFMPGAGGRVREARVCLYTNTPDRHFIIDWVNDGRVLLLSPCSGHGFKFASAIGEIAADLALTGRTWIDLSPFSLKRFS